MRYFLILVVSLLLVSCGESRPAERTEVGQALGTTYSIKYFSDTDVELESALDSIIRVVNHSMSTYQADSDISRLNRGEAVQVDTLFRNVFRLSEQVYRESEGYFDPTVGDLVNMYGFGPEKGLKVIDSSTVDSLMVFVGLEKINISETGEVEKTSPEIYLDFNAIAKGYAIDLIGHYLESREVENFLIELGGELLAKGRNLNKDSYWTVGIDDPEQTADNRTIIKILELKDRAMATSGNYRKTRTDPETGVQYVHTINPLTGYPEQSNLLSVSILAENCALADAYATAFMAMGVKRVEEVLPNLENVDAYLIYSEEGDVREFFTPGFKEALVTDTD